VQVFTVYRYGFELARELAIKERARIERELPHCCGLMLMNLKTMILMMMILMTMILISNKVV